MTTRIYIDEELVEGQGLKFPPTELRYLKSVRRGQGKIEVFNRLSQVATGAFKNDIFWVEEVRIVVVPTYPITLAVGLPDNSIIPPIIRSMSELGIGRLVFFSGGRSQKAKKRLDVGELRWERIAIEAARQCGRGVPLEVSVGNWHDCENFSHRWFCDESNGSDLSQVRISDRENILIVVGCEGGWTDEERQEARELKFTFAHFKTPILRVETAVVCAGFMGVQSYEGAS